jgi:hypothetical protein
MGTTFERRPKICELLVSEGKTLVRWVVTIGRRVWWCVKVNNVLPKGSSYHLLNSINMIMKFHAYEKYNGDGHT